MLDVGTLQRALDAAVDKDRELNAFNTQICAFIENIAADHPDSPVRKSRSPRG